MNPDLITDVEKQFWGKLIGLSFDQVRQYLSRSRVEIQSSEDRLSSAISRHLNEVASWASEISFKDLQRARATSEVFVPLDIYFLPRRNRFSPEEVTGVAPMDTLLSANEGHAVILGQPGAGKTTAVKHICQQLMLSEQLSKLQNFPILIRLRDLNTGRTPKTADECDLITEKLERILDICLTYPEDNALVESEIDRRSVRERVVLDIVETLKPLILLDGLDEIAHKKKRDAVIEELRRLAPRVEKARLILTSRTGEFNYHIDRFTTYEIAPLSESQINEFAKYWLGVSEADTFLSQIRNSPFRDTAIKPLTLAHLCAIYERVHKIPDKPKSVYRKIVRLLLEEWDQQRSIVRESAYADFDVDRKEEFLADLAHCLTAVQKTSIFHRDDLLECFERIHDNYGLPQGEAQQVVNEIETHTGLLIQAGNEIFEFSHKSLQEYLTAVFIHGLPEIPSNMVQLQLMPNELAIATALSSRPAQYFTRLVMEHFRSYNLSFSFIRSFVNRLLIERTDFEKDVEVGVALLLLYSQYLHAFISESAQLQLFIEDQLEDEFAQLGELIRSRISLQEVLKAYNAHSHAHSLDGEQIWRLQRRNHATGAFSLMARANKLPQTLWIRNSLLSPAGITVETLEEKSEPRQIAH